MDNAKLLEALKNGDHKAFEEVFFEYFDKIKKFIAMFLKSDDEAEELTQDIFVRIWVNRDSFNPSKSLNAYMYAIARNATLNLIKHKKLRLNHVAGYVIPDSGSDTEEYLFSKDVGLLIEMLLDRMSLQKQDIYKLSQEEGLPNDEIAGRLGISRKTVENQLSIIMQELRKVIRDYSGRTTLA